MAQISKRAKTAPAACCAESLQSMMDPRFFQALGDPRRLSILAWLASAGRPRSVGEVAQCCPTDMSVVSRHLAQMRDTGIVEAEKKGKEVFYRVNYRALAQTFRAMADAIDNCCPPDTDGQTCLASPGGQCNPKPAKKSARSKS